MRLLQRREKISLEAEVDVVEDVAERGPTMLATREPAGDASPCEACTAGHGLTRNFVWLDHYGASHCPDCEFPPSLGMVARIVWVDGTERQMVDMTKKLLPILEEEFFRRVRAGRIRKAGG